MSKLIKISIIKGTILLETGLHIGAGKDEIEIGGVDSPVIKDPRTNLPIIPGSSIKGKIRSLLELKTGRSQICKCGNCDICMVFGAMNTTRGLTRALFNDSFLSEWSRNLITDNSIMPTEAKKENTIDRTTGTTIRGGLRTTERVIAGLKFDFEISIRIFEEDGTRSIDLLKEGLAMLEKDTLGGSGSRGYGKIKFEELKLDGIDFKLA